MIIVSNRIFVKTGFAEKMAGGFTKGNTLEKFKGFVKLEVLVRTNIKENDELNVNMYWESMEDFEAWRNSDDFKKAHKRPEPGQEPQESPIISNEIVISKIAASK
ncbi:MAG: heme oxygenase [Bacillus sp. (in: firmicutes)]